MRQRVAELYLKELSGVKGLILPNYNRAMRPNYSYLPVRVTQEARVDREGLVDQLRSSGVIPRRYFHPLVPEFQYYRSNASANPELYPVAIKASQEVLCLPIYPELSDATIHYICSTILAVLDP